MGKAGRVCETVGFHAIVSQVEISAICPLGIVVSRMGAKMRGLLAIVPTILLALMKMDSAIGADMPKTLQPKAGPLMTCKYSDITQDYVCKTAKWNIGELSPNLGDGRAGQAAAVVG
jgi:hypothetical protein